MAGTLLIDVKGAFDHVLRTQLTERMEELGADPQLIGCTDNFMTDRKASIVINGHKSGMKQMKTGIPQGSPVSPILFVIYIFGIFYEEELKSAGASLSFVDNVSWLVTRNDVVEIMGRSE
jgi:hypothetical protein